MMQQLVLTFLGLPGCLSASVFREYHFVDLPKTWAEARSHCRERFSDLATVGGQDDGAKLRGVLPEQGAYAWIGLYDESNRWRWSLGDQEYSIGVDFGVWDNGEPNNRISARTCVIIHTHGDLRDNRCEAIRQGLCLDEGGSPRFKLVGEMNWFKARAYCRSHYTDLAVIRNMSEHREIASMISQRTWIGLHRVPWAKWSDETPTTYTVWEKGQPKNHADTTNLCVAVNTTTGAWWSMACHQQHPFICQNVFPVPVRRAVLIALKFRSEAGLTDPAPQGQILKQLRGELEAHDAPDFTLRWSRRDGETFRRETTKKKGSGC